MKYVNNGKGDEKIPLMSLIAILSISLTVNLPGLAITPVIGKIKEVFYPVSELEVELLSSLPNLVIIPIILWTGRLSLHHRKVAILATGLLIFLVGAVAYLFADSLILLGCLVGIGCGFRDTVGRRYDFRQFLRFPQCRCTRHEIGDIKRCRHHSYYICRLDSLKTLASGLCGLSYPNHTAAITSLHKPEVYKRAYCQWVSLSSDYI